MELNETYIIEGTKLREILDKLDLVIEDLKVFSSKHKDCKYSIKICRVDDEKWSAKINVKYVKEDGEGPI